MGIGVDFVDDAIEDTKKALKKAKNQVNDWTKDQTGKVLGEQGAEWLNAFATSMTQDFMNATTFGLTGAAQDDFSLQALARAPGDYATGQLNTYVLPGLWSGYKAYQKVNDGTNGQGVSSTPGTNTQNDPEQQAQFQRMRRAARMLGRAGTIKYKGSGSSLGLGDQMLGDQLSLIGS
jgi:hypothetical protein